MASVTQHYSTHLAPIYVWMAGGVESACRTGAQDIAALVPGKGLAVDLGAGFGMHSIPLARAGYEVIAVDQSRLLLAALREHGAGLPIRVVESDLMEFRAAVRTQVELIVCMGDTLTHLEDFGQVERLLHEIRASLLPGGRFVATFRDYTHPAAGEARFIPVRSDSDRILVCFLEAMRGLMIVHDLLHERRLDLESEGQRLQEAAACACRLAACAGEGRIGGKLRCRPAQHGSRHSCVVGRRA